MHPRQPLPRLWMMTDERQGDALWAALERLPRGSGIVFRHYRLAAGERRELFARVRRAARRRRLVLLLAGTPSLAQAWGADGCHGRRPGPSRLRSVPVRSLRELKAAERAGPDLVFLSPVYTTRSHPGLRPLGRVRFAAIARAAGLPVIALGGMDASKFRGLRSAGAYGWAGIDAWTTAQKRKAVPT